MSGQWPNREDESTLPEQPSSAAPLLFEYGSNLSLGSLFDSQESLESSAARESMDKPFLMLVNACAKHEQESAANSSSLDLASLLSKEDSAIQMDPSVSLENPSSAVVARNAEASFSFGGHAASGAVADIAPARPNRPFGGPTPLRRRPPPPAQAPPPPPADTGTSGAGGDGPRSLYRRHTTALIDCLDNRVDVILTCGHCGIEPTTVIDLTGPVPELIRQGTGDVARLGLQ